MTGLRAAPRGCPDSSALASFVEGALDAQSRREVEQHVADCPECPVVIAETLRFLQADDDEAERESDPPRRQWWWLATAAALAALCVAGMWWDVVHRDPLWRVKQIAAQAPARTVEGQLAGFDYKPFSMTRSDAKAAVDLALRAEAERINERNATDASALHARGVVMLLTGNVALALPLLDAASQRAPNDETVWSDLAAAYVAGGTTADHAQFNLAVAAANRALAISPLLAAAHFNRAVALERLERRNEAIRSYRRAMELEPHSQWSKEIGDLIARSRL